MVVHDVGLDELFDLNVVVVADPDTVAHPDAYLFNNHLLDDTPLYDPFFGFEPVWPFQQEVDDGPGRIADDAEQLMTPSGVAGQSDGSGQVPEFDPLFFQDNFFHTPPEGLLGDNSVPQSHDLWIDTQMHTHTFLQIPEEPSAFTTPLQTTSDSSSDSDPVEPLINSIDSKEITSVTPTSLSLDGETRLGKRKRAEDGVEDEREAGSTSLLPDEIPVCLWRKCGVTFRSLSELRYESTDLKSYFARPRLTFHSGNTFALTLSMHRVVDGLVAKDPPS